MAIGTDPLDVYHNGAWYSRSGAGGASNTVSESSATLSTSIDLSMTGGYYVGPKDCRGVVAFTAAAGAVAGGWAQLTLVADGTNTPSFPATWKAAYGSQAWTNTAGVVHVVTIWYDGFFYWYSISPGASTVYGLTMHSLYVDGTSLVMSSNIAMSTAATPAASCFTVTANGSAVTVSSVTIASTYIILTLASPVTYGQTVTLTINRDGTNYPRASADSSKIAVPVSSASVTNYTDAAAAATTPADAMTNQTTDFRDPTETGFKWVVDSGTATGSWESGVMRSPAGASVTAASGTDFWVEFTYRATDVSPGVYSTAGATHSAPGTASAYVYVSSADGKIKYHVAGGSATDTTVSATEGMRIRLRRTTGNQFQVEYSTDGGSNWTSAAANILSSSSTHYPHAAAFGASGRKTFRPRYSGYV